MAQGHGFDCRVVSRSISNSVGLSIRPGLGGLLLWWVLYRSYGTRQISLLCPLHLVLTLGVHIEKLSAGGELSVDGLSFK